jgi:hypothetical protein
MIKIILNYLSNKKIAIFYSVLFILFLSPLIILGEKSYITIHDNLDGLVVNAIVLTRSGSFWDLSGRSIIPQIMDGIPRGYIGFGYNLIIIPYMLFKPYIAYLINDIIVHFVAFTGMYLLLSKYISKIFDRSLNFANINWGVSLCFAVLPFYSIFGLSVSGLPIIIYALLSLLSNRKIILNFLILILTPLYTMFSLSGIYIFLAISAIFLVSIIIKRKFYWKAFLGLGFYFLLSLVSELDLIQTIFISKNQPSHRIEWNLDYLNVPLGQAINNALTLFLHGQYHASSHHEWILIVAALVVIAIPIHHRREKLILLGAVLLQIFIAFIYGLYTWNGLNEIKSSLGEMSSFNWGRIHWLAPTIWYLILFISLAIIFIKYKNKPLIYKPIIIFVIFIQTGINICYNSEYGHYINKFFTIPNFIDDHITFGQFYSENLFNEIKDYIGIPQSRYRVVSIGIFPSILQYNGFYTLDSYQTTYLLSYKYEFRKIISDELSKTPPMEAYFDYWGSRCYIFTAEDSDFLSTKDKGYIIHNLNLNMQALKNLGGKYIISAAEIENFRAENLVLKKVFQNDDSVWKIYLYQVQ